MLVEDKEQNDRFELLRELKVAIRAATDFGHQERQDKSRIEGRINTSKDKELDERDAPARALRDRGCLWHGLKPQSVVWRLGQYSVPSYPCFLQVRLWL